MGFPSVVRLPSGVYLTGPSYGSSSGRLAGRPSPDRSATKLKHPKAKSCGAERDAIVWYKVSGIPDSAQVIGNYSLASCETTFAEVQHTSSTGAGYCTEAAWASDNPGYDADADQPLRSKRVQVALGERRANVLAGDDVSYLQHSSTWRRAQWARAG